MTRPYRLSAGLAGFFVSAAIGMTACGDSSSPHVASLGKTGGIPSDSTTTLPKGNPTQLLDEWASCMRANGVPDMADPTITSSGAIHITMPADANSNSKVDAGPNGGPCGDYLTAASQALRGGAPIQRPDPTKLLKYSRCMQSNGFPEFPDPSPGGGLSIQIQPGSPMNPNNPTFVSTSKTCSKTAGVPGIGNPASAPRGAIEVQGGSGPAGGPGGNGGSGAVVGTGGTGGNSGLSTSGGKNGA